MSVYAMYIMHLILRWLKIHILTRVIVSFDYFLSRLTLPPVFAIMFSEILGKLLNL